MVADGALRGEERRPGVPPVVEALESLWGKSAGTREGRGRHHAHWRECDRCGGHERDCGRHGRAAGRPAEHRGHGGGRLRLWGGHLGVWVEHELQGKKRREGGVAGVVQDALDVYAERLERGVQGEAGALISSAAGGFLHHTTLAGRIELSFERHGVNDEEVVRKFWGPGIQLNRSQTVREEVREGDSLIFISSSRRRSPVVPWATNTRLLGIVSESGLMRLLQSRADGLNTTTNPASLGGKVSYLMIACIICGSLAFEMT